MSPATSRSSREPDSRFHDEDLFEPSLSENDRLSAFSRPWRPWSIVFASFFGSAPAAGILFSMNYRKLGQPERMLPCLLAFAAISIGLAFAVVLMLDFGAVSEVTAEQKRLSRLMINGTSVLAAVITANLQSKRFDQYERAGSQPDSLWAPGIGAVVFGALAMIGLIMLATVLTGRAA